MRLQFYSLVLIVVFVLFKKCIGYDGPIAGNRSVSECMTGSKTELPKLQITTSDFIKQQGYKAEDHLVQTDDGYLLTLTRIPGPQNAPVVLFQHIFPASAFDWVVIGKGRALAFLLADEGYDVWLGNTRGGLYSRCHVKYTTNEYKFWNFSFHEMAMYDLPAEINYIEKTSGNVDMYYVGASMGTTMSYILAIERPDIASKLKMILSFGPEAYMRHLRGIAPLVAPFLSFLEPIVRFVNHGEVLQQTLPISIMLKFCALSRLTQQLCLFPIFLTVGFDYPQVDYSTVPLFLNHDLVPAAFKVAAHFGQLITSGKFRKYNYGILGNLRAYHSITPPEYDISKVKVPVALFYADNDFLATTKDTEYLASVLPNVTLLYKVNLTDFNHLDFMHANNVKELLYDKVISTIKGN